MKESQEVHLTKWLRDLSTESAYYRMAITNEDTAKMIEAEANIKRISKEIALVFNGQYSSRHECSKDHLDLLRNSGECMVLLDISPEEYATVIPDVAITDSAFDADFLDNLIESQESNE